jgi:MinD-like ATPase involved in chromosome partitioning or flagellar assembly
VPLATASIGDPNARRVITVFSPKGGVGTTTIATNLAVLAAERHTKSTLLIDLDLSFGQVASHLNLQPKQGLLELVRDESALREAELFRTYAAGAPERPAGDRRARRRRASRRWSRPSTWSSSSPGRSRPTRSSSSTPGATRDERMLAIFARSDTVVVPVVPEIPALNAVHCLLDQLSETGALGGQTLFVLNNVFARTCCGGATSRPRSARRSAATCPYDPLAYLRAANEGIPVVSSSPKSPCRAKFRELADAVLGKAGRASRLDERHRPRPEEGAARPVRPALGTCPGAPGPPPTVTQPSRGRTVVSDPTPPGRPVVTILDNVIVRVLTARVAQHNAGRFEDLLRQQLPKMREHEGLIYVKLARQANGAFEEVLLFEEWRDSAALYGGPGDELSRPRLMPGAEALAENVNVTHYEALDVDPDSLVAVPIGTGGDATTA